MTNFKFALKTALITLFCAILAGYGVSRLAAADASASPASADASTKSDGDNCVEPGEGECDDTPDEPCEHEYDETKETTECECADRKAPSDSDLVFCVNKVVSISLTKDGED